MLSRCDDDNTTDGGSKSAAVREYSNGMIFFKKERSIGSKDTGNYGSTVAAKNIMWLNIVVYKCYGRTTYHLQRSGA